MPPGVPSFGVSSKSAIAKVAAPPLSTEAKRALLSTAAGRAMWSVMTSSDVARRMLQLGAVVVKPHAFDAVRRIPVDLRNRSDELTAGQPVVTREQKPPATSARVTSSSRFDQATSQLQPRGDGSSSSSWFTSARQQRGRSPTPQPFRGKGRGRGKPSPTASERF